MRVVVAVVIFVGVSIALGVIFPVVGVTGGGAGFINLVVAIGATVFYWKRSAPQTQQHQDDVE